GPPQNKTAPPPPPGPTAGEPHPAVEYVAGVATTIWPPDSVGNVSLKLAPPTAAAFGLPIVNVSVDVPPATVGVGENALAIVSAAGSMMFAIQLLTEKSEL